MHVVEGGERASMSKRKGEFVTLDELVDEIGIDAARFFLVQRSHDTTLDLDLDLARRQSQDNPVYYVQYAHARLASILRKAGVTEDEAAAAVTERAAAPVAEATERALIKRLLELPAEAESAAAARAPHRICAYATALAADFHAFYRDCQVIGAPEPGVEQARLALCVAAKRTLARTLELVGVEAPEEM
jgi:arginyl-tRNA synthetase